MKKKPSDHRAAPGAPRAVPPSWPASEEQFRLLVMASAEMVYKMSADWQQMYMLVGKDFLADTVLTTNSWLRTYIPAEEQPRVLAAIHEAIRVKGLFEFEHRVIRADGTVGWVYSRAVPLLDAQGEIVEWIGTASDIGARKQAERERLETVLAAQEEERRRIAESLHNGLGQLLYAIKLQLGRLPKTPRLPGADEAAHLLQEAIRQMRALSHELTPVLLEDFGLEAALRTICRTLTTPELHWHCSLEGKAESCLPPPLQLVVYRLAQELAQNVVKHAQARTAALRVEILSKWVVLSVEDDGRGFESTAATGGIGLHTIRSRVELLGGRVRLTSAPGQGTQYRIRIPISPTEQ